jgi:transcription elongation factor Elf1
VKRLKDIKYECPKACGRAHDWRVKIIDGKNYHRIYTCKICGVTAEMKKEDLFFV